MSTIQAPYLVASDANATGSVTAADATNPRKDILYVQVSDTDEDASGSRAATVGYLAGTAAAIPSAPATPARSLLIGVIDVPKVGAGSPAFTGSGLWFVAAGGIVPVPSQAARDALSAYAGQAVWRLDTNQVEIFDGTNWVSPPSFGARAVGLNSAMAATNITATTYTSVPPPSSVGFTKKRGDTNVKVTLQLSWRSPAVPQSAKFAVNIAGTDYDVFGMEITTPANAHTPPCGGVTIITGIAAGGPYTVQVRAKRVSTPAGGAIVCDTNDWISLVVEEVQA
ncbi:hypothetical protein [Dactylosporangium sp. CA-139066]|uniref:hypothetical protein n=1 Tax=Dactylosporangium sp. CA-139066 TaxID=3239930 RepID=UPI003D93488B